MQLVPVSGQLNCTQWRKLNAYDSLTNNRIMLKKYCFVKTVAKTHKNVFDGHKLNLLQRTGMCSSKSKKLKNALACDISVWKGRLIIIL